jgi:hypothetical protein
VSSISCRSTPRRKVTWTHLCWVPNQCQRLSYHNHRFLNKQMEATALNSVNESTSTLLGWAGLAPLRDAPLGPL